MTVTFGFKSQSLLSKDTHFLRPIVKTITTYPQSTHFSCKDPSFLSSPLLSHQTLVKRSIIYALNTRKQSGSSRKVSEAGDEGGGSEVWKRFFGGWFDGLTEVKKKQVSEFLLMLGVNGMKWLLSGKVKKSDVFPLALFLLPIILYEEGDNTGVKDLVSRSCITFGWIGWMLWKIK